MTQVENQAALVADGRSWRFVFAKDLRHDDLFAYKVNNRWRLDTALDYNQNPAMPEAYADRDYCVKTEGMKPGWAEVSCRVGNGHGWLQCGRDFLVLVAS